MKNKILVPVDFEQQSISNLQWAKYFAAYSKSQIILCHIIEESGFLKRMFKQENFEQKVKKEAMELLKEICDQNFTNGESCHITIEKGKPYEEIVDLADEFEPHLILLGKNENSTKSKRYLGSNTLHVINETDYPVITIYGNQSPEKAKPFILLPLDLNKSISEQTTVAVEFAKYFNASVKAVNVCKEDSISDKSETLVKMNKLKKFFEQNNIICETDIIYENVKNPAEIVNKIADDLNPMLVIIMLREESNFKNFFIGSIAQDIIEKCNAPVMSVKPWNEEVEENPFFRIIYNPLNL